MSIEDKNLFGDVELSDRDNVYLKKPTQKKTSSNIEETIYCLEIHCKDEGEQELLFNEFKKRGYKCRVLTL